MSVKRRDSKNRVLRNGESQRPDGRYAYVYTDSFGKQKFVYSWKLEDTDRLPKGKRECESLRSKIKKIQKDLADGIVSGGGNLTVLQVAEKFFRQKSGVRRTTKKSFDGMLKLLGNEPFGAKRIDLVKPSDAKEFLVHLRDDGRKYGTVLNIKTWLHSIFQSAVEDDLIRKNPFHFNAAGLLQKDTEETRALTKEQEKSFLEFVRTDSWFSQYYDEVYILFHTGMRISEFVGLTDADLDFENGLIRVERQLVEDQGKLYVQSPKTASGIRTIPMIKDVPECFKRMMSRRSEQEKEQKVDGLCGFLSYTRRKMGIASRGTWSGRFLHMELKYNAVNNSNLHVTPHVCRHTFCTRMAMYGMNPKVLQYVAGHSNIGITLNIYTHIECDDVKSEMERISSLY